MKSLYQSIGIYMIRNKITGKGYIGQTANNFGDRRDSNFAKLRHNKHDNIDLQEDWNNFGEENYEFVVLEDLESPRNIDEREKFWIAKFKSEGKSFNQQNGGKGYSGLHLTDNAKKIIGEKNRLHNLGKKASEETKLKMSASHKGLKQSLEHIERTRQRMIGTHLSDSTKQKISMANSGEKSALAKYTKEQIILAREIYDSGNHNYKYIEEKTGIKRTAIHSIVKRKRWKNV
jgi:group I intron endonuclease